MDNLPTIQEQDEGSKTSLVLKNPNSLLDSDTKSASLGFLFDRKSNSEHPPTHTHHQRYSNNSEAIVAHARSSGVTLLEDCFGLYRTDDKTSFPVQRYTWKRGLVEVQIITYGARIVSMKYPDKRGITADVVLGFNDVAGYLYYDEHLFGATIGAVSGKIKDACFELKGKRIRVSESENGYHKNGGQCGLNKVLWNSYVSGTKVILSHVIPHRHEGLPGPVMISITYELTSKNEFHINMEAKSGRPTIINLSNLCYFNLAGHHSGPEELKNHSVLINCNCYTLMDESDFPTGRIMSVVNTKFDFLQPKLLRDYLGVEPNDGFDQNLCVNRGVSQKNCLVARIVHTHNGRVMEIHSNQYGVRFETANGLGLGVVSVPTQPRLSSLSEEGGIFILLNRIYQTMTTMECFTDTNFEEVHRLLVKIRNIAPSSMTKPDYLITISFVNPDFYIDGFVDALHRSLIPVQNTIPAHIEDVKTWSEMKIIVQRMLQKYQEMDQQVTHGWSLAMSEEMLSQQLDRIETGNGTELTSEIGETSQQKSGGSVTNKSASIENKSNISANKSSQSAKDKSASKEIADLPSGDETDQHSTVSNEGNTSNRSTQSATKSPKSSTTNRSSQSTGSSKKEDVKSVGSPVNVIPSFYKDGRIHGKHNAIYKRHCAMAFQTQNYPDAVHHDNFPNSILNPGETYKHSIVYKFWAQDEGLHGLRKKRKCQ